MSIPTGVKYTKEHEWAKPDGDMITVGVTDYAQEMLGDIVYIEIPTSGEEVNQGEPFGTIESTKSVSDLMSPVTGYVIEGNVDLIDTPQIVNEDPYGDGWIMKVSAETLDELEELMTAAEYEQYVADLADE